MQRVATILALSIQLSKLTAKHVNLDTPWMKVLLCLRWLGRNQHICLNEIQKVRDILCAPFTITKLFIDELGS